MNIIDYIKKHGNKTFKEKSFNEVDALILSVLPYLDFKDIVPAFKKGKISLKDASKQYQKIDYKKNVNFLSNLDNILKVMENTKRYGNAYLYHYMNIVNNEMQFGALTIKLNDNSIFVAFAGTDSSIIGWEEDFKMAYLYPGKSQKYAEVYLNKTIKLFDLKIRVGGHSKGGNLAISSVMNSNFYLRKRIIEIYNFDGPGFLKEQVTSKKYQNIENKIKMYVPEESIIGMILYHINDYTVVKARSFYIFQHDAFNWLVNDSNFVKSKQNRRSQNIEKKLTQKLEELSIPKRLKLVQDVFNLFKENNIKDTKDLKIKKVFSLIKSFNELDNETKSLFRQFLFIILLS